MAQPAPPAIGHGPSNLFGGIMANPPGQGNPGLVPPSQDQQQQQGPPPHQMPQPQQGLQSGPYQGNYPQPPVVNGKTQTFMGLGSSLVARPMLTYVYRLRIASADCFPRSWQATQQPRAFGPYEYPAAVSTYVLFGSFPSNGKTKPSSAVPQRWQHACRPGS